MRTLFISNYLNPDLIAKNAKLPTPPSRSDLVFAGWNGLHPSPADFHCTVLDLALEPVGSNAPRVPSFNTQGIRLARYLTTSSAFWGLGAL